jgi:hypothetical protein
MYQDLCKRGRGGRGGVLSKQPMMRRIFKLLDSVVVVVAPFVPESGRERGDLRGGGRKHVFITDSLRAGES